MKELEKKNLRLRQAISDLTLDKLILQETARENFCPLHGDGVTPIMCDKSFRCPNDGSAGCRASIDRRSARCRAGQMTNKCLALIVARQLKHEDVLAALAGLFIMEEWL